MSLSVADLLAANDATASVLTVPPDGVLLVRLARQLRHPEDAAWARRLLARLADRLGIEPGQVLVIEAGTELQALGHDELAQLGLSRIGADG